MSRQIGHANHQIPTFILLALSSRFSHLWSALIGREPIAFDCQVPASGYVKVLLQLRAQPASHGFGDLMRQIWVGK
jgi:hypothetical protein